LIKTFFKEKINWEEMLKDTYQDEYVIEEFKVKVIEKSNSIFIQTMNDIED